MGLRGFVSRNQGVVISNLGGVISSDAGGVVNRNLGGVISSDAGVVNSDVESSSSGRDVNSYVMLCGLTGLSIALLALLLYNLCNIVMPS